MVEGKIMKHVRLGKQVCTLVGRGEHSHEQLHHQSSSRQHAVVIHAQDPNAPPRVDDKGSKESKEPKPADDELPNVRIRLSQHELLLVDLYSTHGTFLNDQRMEPGVPVRLYDYDVIQFGASERRYKVKGLGERRGQAKPSGASATADKTKDSKTEKRKERDEPTPSDVQPPEKKAKTGDGATVRVRHILVKHRGSRRPSSWKEKVITRSVEEASAKIAEFRKLIAAGEAKFEDVASKHSDCGSYKHGGDLGRFGRGKMQPPFEKAS